MACALGIEQDCNECRMCGNGKGGKKMTNFERIKGMSAEELAKTIYELDFDNGLCPLYDMYEKRKNDSGGCSYDCKECLLEWLESECDAEC